MPWECRTVKEQREAFAKLAALSSNFSALCREFGITRRTGYKWLERYEAGEPMTDRSHAAERPNRTPPELEAEILAFRLGHTKWGGKKIKEELEKKLQRELPSVRTIANILLRNGQIDPAESAKRQAYTRFQMDNCNDLWQADFKGEFRTEDQQYCYPLDILDDCSRFALASKAYTATSNVVLPTFRDVFRQYGLPRAILTDNGAQFAGAHGGITQFERWLMDLDILPIHGRVMHPQTQGKIERFHRTMKAELLTGAQFTDCDSVNAALLRWLDEYNYHRPHEALGMKYPGQVYTPSNRVYPEEIPAYTYDGKNRVTKVNSWGYARFAGYQVYLSEAMINQYVEFRHSDDGERFIACYRNFSIASFSTTDGSRIDRKISRL